MVPQYWPPVTVQLVRPPASQFTAPEQTLFEQVLPSGQSPQTNCPPQPSPTVPQYEPPWLAQADLVSGAQGPVSFVVRLASGKVTTGRASVGDAVVDPPLPPPPLLPPVEVGGGVPPTAPPF
jgi:hypothetical protein